MKPTAKNKIFGIEDRKVVLIAIVLTLIPYNIIPFVIIYYLSKKHKDTKTFSYYYARNFLNLAIHFLILLVLLFWTQVIFLLVALAWYLILVFAALEAYEGKKYTFFLIRDFLK
jgi:hypothetical protein